MSGQKGDFMPIYTDKKTKRLWVQFDFDGNTYKRRLPAKTTKKQAEKIETKWKHNLFFEKSGVVSDKVILFEDFLIEYYLPFAEQNHSKVTYDNKVRICKASLPYFGGKNMRQIKAAEVEKFKNYRTNLKTQHDTPRKPATVLRELSIISKVFSLAITNDFLEYNPCSRVEKPSNLTC
jgi:hypothetical protein